MTNKEQYLALDVAQLATELSAIMAAYPELEEDDELRADTVEGETNLYNLLGRLINQAEDAKAMAGAVGERISAMHERKKRFERKNDAMRGLMFKLMVAAKLPKAQLPEGTVSVGKGRESVLITDEALLPKWAFRVTKAPDKVAIKEKLDAGKKVLGAEIKQADDVLKLRVA